MDAGSVVSLAATLMKGHNVTGTKRDFLGFSQLEITAFLRNSNLFSKLKMKRYLLGHHVNNKPKYFS